MGYRWSLRLQSGLHPWICLLAVIFQAGFVLWLLFLSWEISSELCNRQPKKQNGGGKKSLIRTMREGKSWELGWIQAGMRAASAQGRRCCQCLPLGAGMEREEDPRARIPERGAGRAAQGAEAAAPRLRRAEAPSCPANPSRPRGASGKIPASHGCGASVSSPCSCASGRDEGTERDPPSRALPPQCHLWQSSAGSSAFPSPGAVTGQGIDPESSAAPWVCQVWEHRDAPAFPWRCISVLSSSLPLIPAPEASPKLGLISAHPQFRQRRHLPTSPAHHIPKPQPAPGRAQTLPSRFPGGFYARTGSPGSSPGCGRPCPPPLPLLQEKAGERSTKGGPGQV